MGIDIQSTDEPFRGHLVNMATFQTPLKHSYSCLAEETLESPKANFTLKIREVQLEAYRLTPPGHREFSTRMPIKPFLLTHFILSFVLKELDDLQLSS